MGRHRESGEGNQSGAPNSSSARIGHRNTPIWRSALRVARVRPSASPVVRDGDYGFVAGFGSGLRFLIQPLAIWFFLNDS